MIWKIQGGLTVPMSGSSTYKDIIMPLTAPSIALVTIYNAVPLMTAGALK